MNDPYEVIPKDLADPVVRPPGSKSITNRAMIAAALAPGRSTLSSPLRSTDTEAMIGCLDAMGVRITTSEHTFEIHSTGYLAGGGALDARDSGTTARFITAAATLADGRAVVDGTERMRHRPIGGLVDALTVLGANLEASGGYPPVRIAGGGLQGGTVGVDTSQSSQFASAVMLCAPCAAQPVVLELGSGVVSRPYLDTTIEVMQAFGAHVGWESSETIRVESTGYRPTEFLVEADASAAVYPWAAAAVTGSTVTVTGIDPWSTQADVGVLGVFELMGCIVQRSVSGISVTGPRGLAGASVDMNRCPDAVLAVAVVAAFAASPTEIHNVGTLRIKESDRLHALETELTKLGAAVTTGPDWIHIHPGPTRPAVIATYDDHRMAMSFAIAGLRQRGVAIGDPGCVTKTWPEFFDMLESL